MFKKTKEEKDSTDYRLGYIKGSNDGYRKAFSEMIELIDNGFYNDLPQLKKSLQDAVQKEKLS